MRARGEEVPSATGVRGAGVSVRSGPKCRTGARAAFALRCCACCLQLGCGVGGRVVVAAPRGGNLRHSRGGVDRVAAVVASVVAEGVQRRQAHRPAVRILVAGEFQGGVQHRPGERRGRVRQLREVPAGQAPWPGGGHAAFEGEAEGASVVPVHHRRRPRRRGRSARHPAPLGHDPRPRAHGQTPRADPVREGSDPVGDRPARARTLVRLVPGRSQAGPRTRRTAGHGGRYRPGG